MPFKTILVHVDLSVHAPARIRLAAAIAKAEGAHVLGAAMTGVSRFMYSSGVGEAERPDLAGYFARLAQDAAEALDRFAALMRECGVASSEHRLVEDDPEGGLVLLSRFADLVVLSQSDPGSPVPNVVRDLPEYVVLNVARPVLMVPYAGQFAAVDGKALVAWDGSLEASRALANALPLLRHSSQVLVAQFNPAEAADRAAQSVDLADWLGRHGIKARVELRHGPIDTGGALLSLAADEQAGLIVMGGYGHTRFRELLLGGATKTVLESMTAPVLMSH